MILIEVDRFFSHEKHEKSTCVGVPAIKQIERYNLKMVIPFFSLKSNSKLIFLHTKYPFDMLEAVKNCDIIITVITKTLSRR